MALVCNIMKNGLNLDFYNYILLFKELITWKKYMKLLKIPKKQYTTKWNFTIKIIFQKKFVYDEAVTNFW